MSKLSHFNPRGEARMVDIGAKPVTRRVAVAEGRILMQAETLRLIEAGENQKGDVLCIARIAGIMGAKKTADLVPLCHPLSLTHVEVDLVPIPDEGAVGRSGNEGHRCAAYGEVRREIGYLAARGVSQRRRTARTRTLSGTV